jgi:hypothetical protein
MKTYPYQDGDKLIQLVEKRELDQLLERLAEARESHIAASSRDVQTIQRQAIMLKRLARALRDIAWVKETGHRDYSWTGDTAFTALTAYEASKLEPAANPVDEAVRRMEAAPDLLEALEAIMDSDLWEWNGSAAFWLQDKVKAAIAKAKGEL